MIEPAHVEGKQLMNSDSQTSHKVADYGNMMLLSNRIRILTRNVSQFSKVLSQQVKPKSDEKPKDKNLVFHDQYNIAYKRLPHNDKQLNSLMMTVKSKKKLLREQQIIVEGNNLIKEAVEAHLKLNFLLFAHIEKISDVVDVMGKSSSNVQFIKVPHQDLTYWSVLTTCPGLIGIFDKPKSTPHKRNAFPITVICDNIREPNNVGAVIRLSNSLPALRVVLPKGCADAWDVKAIRGSSGSIFHMPTDEAVTWQQIDNELNDPDALVLIADNDVSKYLPSTVISYDKISDDLIAGRNIYVVLGGETHGISEDARTFAFKRLCKVVQIPLDSTVNSLNTSNALAIILFELRRRLAT